MKRILGFSILSFSLFLAACEDPAANKVRAVTSTASTPATSVTSSAPCATALACISTPDDACVRRCDPSAPPSPIRQGCPPQH